MTINFYRQSMANNKWMPVCNTFTIEGGEGGCRTCGSSAEQHTVQKHKYTSSGIDNCTKNHIDGDSSHSGLKDNDKKALCAVCHMQKHNEIK